MFELIAPTAELHRAWLEFRDEWGGEVLHGSGISPKFDVETREGFAAWAR
jgi:hypothetical protein